MFSLLSRYVTCAAVSTIRPAFRPAFRQINRSINHSAILASSINQQEGKVVNQQEVTNQQQDEVIDQQDDDELINQQPDEGTQETPKPKRTRRAPTKIEADDVREQKLKEKALVKKQKEQEKKQEKKQQEKERALVKKQKEKDRKAKQKEKEKKQKEKERALAKKQKENERKAELREKTLEIKRKALDAKQKALEAKALAKQKKEQLDAIEKSRPKRPTSAYLLYIKERYHAVQESHPDLTSVECVKMLASEWRALSDEDKQKYQDRIVTELKPKYEKELADFQAKYPKPPKRPAGAFMIYLVERREDLLSQNPDISIIDAAKKCSSEWRSLTDGEKAPYRQKYYDAVVQYRKTLNEWQAANPSATPTRS